MIVFARRTEKNNIKYFGATIVSFFVQRMLYVSFISPMLSDIVPGTTLFSFDEHFGLIFGLFALAGSVIGVIGSVFPVKKYLDV